MTLNLIGAWSGDAGQAVNYALLLSSIVTIYQPLTEWIDSTSNLLLRRVDLSSFYRQRLVFSELYSRRLGKAGGLASSTLKNA